MDLLKAQIERLQKQLSGLSASQRMLTAALLAIMVITLIWWGRYAGEAEMEPILDQSFSQEDITHITTDLASRGIRYTVTGDRVYVPTERKFEVLASLSYSHLLPRDTKVGFDEMIKQMSPWQPEKTTDAMFNRGKEMMLSQIIQNYPHVEHADVMIDPTHERHVEGSVEPSATVAISMQNKEKPTSQLVNAAADVVQGAQSGLARSQIKVVVDGVPQRLHDPQSEEDISAAGSDQLELVQKAEVLYAGNIREFLSWIPELKVSVAVKINATSVHEQIKKYDPKGTIQKETQTTSENDETNTPAPSSAEPGVTSNVGLSVTPAAAAPVATNTHGKDTTNFQVLVPETNTTTTTPSGGVTIIAATVRVPMSYFRSAWTSNQGNSGKTTATDAQLQPFIDAELPKIRKDVLKCTGLQSDQDVSVETYLDAVPAFVAGTAPAPATASMTTLIGGHTKDLVLGGLAVMSLFMVSMMVRKGAPVLASPVAAAVPSESPPILAGEPLAGEAGANNALLDGMELDDEAVRTQQMLDQVSTMVKENPEAAATLVKRWMSRT